MLWWMCGCLIYDNFVSGSCCGYRIEMLDSVKFLTRLGRAELFLNRRERYLRFSSLTSLLLIRAAARSIFSHKTRDQLHSEAWHRAFHRSAGTNFQS